MLALNEVQPAFGVNEEELEAVVQNGIIHFDNSIHVRRPLHRYIRSATVSSAADIIHDSTDDSPRREVIGRTSPSIATNAPRLSPHPRSTRFGKDRSRRYDRSSFSIPLHQTHLR